MSKRLRASQTLRWTVFAMTLLLIVGGVWQGDYFHDHPWTWVLIAVPIFGIWLNAEVRRDQ